MRRRHNPPVSACLQDYTMHAPDASCDNRSPPKKSHPYLAFTSLMHGAHIQPWTFRPTCRTHRKRQPRVSQPPTTCPGADPTRSPEEEARDILAAAVKNQAEDGPSTRKAAIRAYKYLRAMVTQHGSRLQEVYDAAKVHSVAEVQQRRQTGIPLRNMTSQRQRLSCTVHPPCLIHGPQPKLQSTWMAPVSGSLRCVGFSLRMSMLGVPQAHIQLRTS